MTTSEYELRAGTAEDWEDIRRVLSEAFNEDLEDDMAEAERGVYEPQRTVLAVRDGEIAGVSASYTRDLTVPGAVVPAAHVTMVGVSVTHRRQGLLNRMIDVLHADAMALGEPVAVLWASEGRIYQRYGYGLAAKRLVIEARNTDVRLLDPLDDDGRIRAVAVGSTDEFQKVFDQARLGRPGWSHRDERWWSYMTSDPVSGRRGATALRAIVHDGPSGVDGYMLWRVKQDWDDVGANSMVMVREFIALTPEAYHSMCRFAFSVDLTRSMRMSFAAMDEPLQNLVDEPRRLQMRVFDSLWIRVLDVPGALAARRYAAPVDVVIEVDDPRIQANNGRWRLVADQNSATCTRTSDDADLRVHVRALGSVYLGGQSLMSLADGGRVREIRPGALVPATTAFGWHKAPSATEMF